MRRLSGAEKREMIGTLWGMTLESFGKDSPSREKYDQCLRDGDVWVVNERISGLLMISGHAIVTKLWNGFVKLRHICVSPSFRKLGYGHALLMHMSEFYKEAGMQRIILDVDRNNIVAQRLYLNEGFLFNKILHDKYGPGRDGIEMEKTL